MGADDRTREERRRDDEMERLAETHCYDCAMAIVRGDWEKHEGDYCSDCYRIWAESQRPLLAASWSNPRYAEIAPVLSDELDEIVLSGREPEYRDSVDPLELLGRGATVLAEAAYSLLREAKDMNDNLSGCDWCCGGGDERMQEIQLAFQRINEQAKELG